MPRPTALFRPYHLVNQAYGQLRAWTVESNFAHKERSSCIDQFAIGFIRDTTVTYLDPDKVAEILSRHGGRGRWKMSCHLSRFTPEFVREALQSHMISEQHLTQLLKDRKTFIDFCENEMKSRAKRSNGSAAVPARGLQEPFRPQDRLNLGPNDVASPVGPR